MNCQVSLKIGNDLRNLVSTISPRFLMQDDLTVVDLESTAGIIASTSTGSTVSLYPLIAHSGSHATNIQIPDSLTRILRPLDSKDVCIPNEVGDDLAKGYSFNHES